MMTSNAARCRELRYKCVPAWFARWLGTGVTIYAKKPELVFPWAAGFEIIDAYAENLGEWGDCCICTVTDILLGPGALPLMVGLLELGSSSIYQKCLNGMRLYLEGKRSTN